MSTPAGPRHAYNSAAAYPAAGPGPAAGPAPAAGIVPAPRAAPGGGPAPFGAGPDDDLVGDTDRLPVVQVPPSLFVPQGPEAATEVDGGSAAFPTARGPGPAVYAPAYDPGSSHPGADAGHPTRGPGPTGPAPAQRRPGPGHPPASPGGSARPVKVVPVLLALVVGALVAVGLGVYGRFHQPTGVAISVSGFSSGLAAKSWLASLALVFVLVQLVSARRIYRGGGRLAAGLHRWSGRIAVLVTVPVAIHCLYALGFQDFSVRVLAHSLAGCFFYGAFVAKMMVLGSRSRTPGWAIPVLGGAVLTGFTAIWLTSSLWFFTSVGFSF